MTAPARQTYRDVLARRSIRAPIVIVRIDPRPGDLVLGRVDRPARVFGEAR